MVLPPGREGLGRDGVAPQAEVFRQGDKEIAQKGPGRLLPSAGAAVEATEGGGVFDRVGRGRYGPRHCRTEAHANTPEGDRGQQERRQQGGACP